MVARDHSPEASANAALGDEFGGNVESTPPDAETFESAEVTTPESEEAPKDEGTSESVEVTPKKSGPGLRTTNTPMRRAR